MFEPDDAMTYWGFILSLAATFQGEINLQFNKTAPKKNDNVVLPTCFAIT